MWSTRTGHCDLVAWLGIAKEVGAEALLCGVIGLQLWAPVLGTANAQGCGLAVEGVSVATGRDGIQPCSVRNLLTLRVDFCALRTAPQCESVEGCQSPPADQGRPILVEEPQFSYDTVILLGLYIRSFLCIDQEQTTRESPRSSGVPEE